MAEFRSGSSLKKFLADTDWAKDRRETERKYQAGDITDVERGVSNVAGSVEAALTPVNYALEGMFGMLPQGLQDTISSTAQDVGEAVQDTSLYKYGAGLARENPRTAAMLGDAATIAGVLPATRLAKSPSTTLQRVTENAPNELPLFYKGLAPLEMAAAVPSTLAKATREAMSPRARASAREGVNVRLRDTIKKNDAISELYAKKAAGADLTTAEKARIKGLEVRHQEDIEKIARSRPSFTEGQLEQSSLFGIQKTGDVPDALKTFHSDYSFSDFGPLTRNTLDVGFKGRSDLEWVGEGTKNFLMGNIKKTFNAKDPSKFQFVIKKNNAFTDLTQEARMKIASQTAKRMYKAKQELAKIDPSKKQFKSVDELKDFVALRFLDDSDRLKKYLTYQKKLKDGGKLTKTQLNIYKEILDVVKENRNKVKFVNKFDGQVVVQSSHVSQSKAAGGVADMFVFDLDGNVMHTMLDKNDLAAIPKTNIELEFPKGSKMVTMTEPYVYNVFGKEVPKAGNVPDSKAFREGIERKTGVPFQTTGTGQSKKDLITQVSRGIGEFQPTPTRQDYLGAARNIAVVPGLLTAASGTEEGEP